MLLAFVGFVSSCENDDIEIVKEKARYKVSLNVATQGMYDEFGITDKIKTDFLRDGSYVIGINTFIYDTSGKLVTSKFDYVNNYNILNMEFEEVEEGNYTILTIETLVNPDNGYEPNFFEINDIEDITKIKLSQKYYKIGSSAVIGVYSNDISVSSDMSLYVTPKAIGSLINVHPSNYEHSPYVKWGIGTNDALDYYFLNPQLPRKSRFYEDLTKRGYVNIRLRADTENSSDYYWPVYVLESSIEWKPVAQTAENDDEEYITWKVNKADLEDGKTYEAGCYYLYEENENSYVASYFGDRDGLSDWEKDWDDVLKALVTNSKKFTAPYTDWNVGTVSAVKNYMRNMTLLEDITYSTYSSLYYMEYADVNNKDIYYTYYFNTATTGLTSVYVAVMNNLNYSDVKNELLKQGYVTDSEDESWSEFHNSSTIVGIYHDESGIYLYYNEKSNSKDSRIINLPKSRIQKSENNGLISPAKRVNKGMSSIGYMHSAPQKVMLNMTEKMKYVK